MPFVWETVHGIHKLLALLPNVTISRPDDLGHKVVLYINLPDPDGTSFERFDYYAPLVKHLSFFGNNTYYPDLAGWELLSERARKQPLFPNLLSLTVPEHFHEPLSEEQLCQISDLISPSLVAYWSVPIPSALLPLRVPKTAALVILDPLVERCSVIQCLAIYPKAGSQICQDLPASFGSLPFSHLRELSGSAALVASDLLVVIGALPQLESLSIHGFNQYLPPLPDELPGTSFPALKHLYFSTLYSEDALGLAQLEHLLCRLEFLELQVDLYAMDEDLDGDERALALTQDIMSAWLEKTL
ncbi:hypothetical protein FRC12_023662 [Ceratobasidium sp. 428]|nr:hypothetical protein FRC12_023662 [Ceratobasidium sp. 428]